MLRFGEQGIPIGAAPLKLPGGSSELGLGVLLALILIFRPNGLAGGKEIALIRGPRGTEPHPGSPAAASPLRSDTNAVA